MDTMHEGQGTKSRKLIVEVKSQEVLQMVERKDGLCFVGTI